jgi:ABC-type proline/glycine betaine transport system ATPase subunit
MATAMQRDVYEKQPIDNFRVQRIESLALSPSEKRIFVGTVDGALMVFNNAANIFDNPSNCFVDNLCGLHSLLHCRLTAIDMWRCGYDKKAAQGKESSDQSADRRGTLYEIISVP